MNRRLCRCSTRSTHNKSFWQRSHCRITTSQHEDCLEPQKVPHHHRELWDDAPSTFRLTRFNNWDYILPDKKLVLDAFVPYTTRTYARQTQSQTDPRSTKRRATLARTPARDAGSNRWQRATLSQEAPPHYEVERAILCNEPEAKQPSLVSW